MRCQTTIFLLCLLIGLSMLQNADAQVSPDSAGYALIRLARGPGILYIDDDWMNPTSFDMEVIVPVDTDPHRITVALPCEADFVTQVHVAPGDTARITFQAFREVSDREPKMQRSYAMLSTGKNVTIFTDAVSDVYADGSFAGTGMTALRLTHPRRSRSVSTG